MVRPETAKKAAAAAEPGDLLVELAGEPLLSCVTFAERAAAGTPLRLTVLRGTTSVPVTLTPDR